MSNISIEQAILEAKQLKEKQTKLMEELKDCMGSDWVLVINGKGQRINYGHTTMGADQIVFGCETVKFLSFKNMFTSAKARVEAPKHKARVEAPRHEVEK